MMDQLKPTKPGLIIAIVLASLPSVLLLSLQTYTSFHPEDDFLLSLGQIAFFIVWLALFIIAIPFAFWKKKPQILAYWFAGIVLLLGMFALLKNFPIPDYIHFAANYADYQNIVNKAPQNRHTFSWGSEGMAGVSVNIIRSIIYDPQDLLPMQNLRKNEAWKNKDRKHHRVGMFPSNMIRTYYLPNHYYLVEEFYQG